MDKGNIAILIVARSISLSDGLDALLKAIPLIDEVQIARNFASVYQQIGTRQIQIILIDSNLLGNDPPATLEKIKMLSPETQRVLLLDDVQDVNLMPRYAEAILIKGAAPSAVAAIVTNLLSGKGEVHELND
jgi:DNA-binding NarL/FixJ family response regulator